jgi:hypothetical protein
MRVESALELQARIFSQIFNFIELPAAAGMDQRLPGLFLDPMLLETKSARPRKPPRRRANDIALGVTQGAGDGDAKLAVLVQNRNKIQSAVVEEIVGAARGEAEVLYIGRQKPLWTTARNDPLRLGASISPTTVKYSGTLGCFCRDTLSGAIGILSNNHVLADVNGVRIGTTIMQPGAGDGGRAEEDVIAQLSRFVPIQFGGFPNRVDAAFAALTEHGRGEDRGSLFDSSDEPAPAIALNPGEIAEALPGMIVHKTGRTTRHTRGRVRAVNVNNYLVDVGVAVARFDGQMVIETEMAPQPFSRPGDSGSLIVDEEGRPVALLFAGSASGGVGNVGITGANPISYVTEQLGVTLV